MGFYDVENCQVRRRQDFKQAIQNGQAFATMDCAKGFSSSLSLLSSLTWELSILTYLSTYQAQMNARRGVDQALKFGGSIP